MSRHNDDSFAIYCGANLAYLSSHLFVTCSRCLSYLATVIVDQYTYYGLFCFRTDELHMADNICGNAMKKVSTLTVENEYQ